MSGGSQVSARKQATTEILEEHIEAVRLFLAPLLRPEFNARNTAQTVVHLMARKSAEQRRRRARCRT